MVSLRLEQMGTSSGTLKLNCKSVAMLGLWTTQLETSPQPQWFAMQSHSIRRLFLRLRAPIYLANPGLTAIYLDVLLGCIVVSRDHVTEHPGSGQVARAASMCLMHVLSSVHPTSTATQWIRQRYLNAVPRNADFEGLLCHHMMNAINALLIGGRERRFFAWTDYKPRAQERVFFAVTLVHVAYTRRLSDGKVPRWVLRFAIDSLSRHPPPPTSVVLDCLSIVAIDLDCDVSSGRTTTADERYVQYLTETDFSDLEPVHGLRRFRTSWSRNSKPWSRPPTLIRSDRSARPSVHSLRMRSSGDGKGDMRCSI